MLGANLAQQCYAVLIGGLGSFVFLFAARQITKGIQRMRNSKGIARLSGNRQAFV